MVEMVNHADSKVSKKAVLFIATMVSFLGPFMGSAFNIALPSIGKDLGIDAVLLTWTSTSFLVAAAVFLVPFGRLADIHGRKKIFTYGIVIWTVASVLSAVSTSAAMLIAFRILQGIGGAMTFGTAVAILISVYPFGERGKVLGINVAAVYLGLSMGPFLGGLLTHHFGWRSVFLINLPIGIIIMTFVFWKLKGEWAEAKGEKFDLSGSIIYGLSLVVLMIGLSLLPSAEAVWPSILGILGILAFIWWEMRVESPVLHMDLFRNNPVFAFSNLAALINYAATFAVTFLMSLYLQYNKGFSPQTAGLVLVSMPAIQAIFSPIAGRLSDRIEPRILASLGMALSTIGLGMLIFLDQDTTIGFILASLIVLGLGFGLFSSPNTNAVMSSVEKRSYGVASATLGTMRQLGMIFSMGIAMITFVVFIGRVEITPEYYPAFIQSLHISFIVFTALCFGGIFASMARGKIR